jgi:glycyl-tRNA synthetase (class II)
MYNLHYDRINNSENDNVSIGNNNDGNQHNTHIENKNEFTYFLNHAFENNTNIESNANNDTLHDHNDSPHFITNETTTPIVVEPTVGFDSISTPILNRLYNHVQFNHDGNTSNNIINVITNNVIVRKRMLLSHGRLLAIEVKADICFYTN